MDAVSANVSSATNFVSDVVPFKRNRRVLTTLAVLLQAAMCLVVGIGCSDAPNLQPDRIGSRISVGPNESNPSQEAEEPRVVDPAAGSDGLLEVEKLESGEFAFKAGKRSIPIDLKYLRKYGTVKQITLGNVNGGGGANGDGIEIRVRADRKFEIGELNARLELKRLDSEGDILKVDGVLAYGPRFITVNPGEVFYLRTWVDIQTVSWLNVRKVVLAPN